MKASPAPIVSLTSTGTPGMVGPDPVGQQQAPAGPSRQRHEREPEASGQAPIASRASAGRPNIAASSGSSWSFSLSAFASSSESAITSRSTNGGRRFTSKMRERRRGGAASTSERIERRDGSARCARLPKQTASAEAARPVAVRVGLDPVPGDVARMV